MLWKVAHPVVGDVRACSSIRPRLGTAGHDARSWSSWLRSVRELRLDVVSCFAYGDLSACTRVTTVETGEYVQSKEQWADVRLTTLF